MHAAQPSAPVRRFALPIFSPADAPPAAAQPTERSPMTIRGYFSNLDITWTNAAVAVGAAVVAFIALHGAVMLFRRRLDKLDDARAHKPIVEVLRHTLARTSSLAVLATSIQIG